MSKKAKTTDAPELPAELTRLRELEAELRDLLRRREQIEGLLEKARAELQEAKRQRASLAHLSGTDTLDRIREAEREAASKVESLTEDLRDMENGAENLKLEIIEAEKAARKPVMDWWRARKAEIVDRIAPIAEQLRPLLGDLRQATEGETLSSMPDEQFWRTVVIPLLTGGGALPSGSVQDVPISKYQLESALVSDQERYVQRDLARMNAAPAQTSPLPGTPNMPGRVDFNTAAQRVARELGLDAVAAKVVVSRALDDGRLKHVRFLGKIMVKESDLGELIEQIALERLEKKRTA
ncbi:MAG: hypothetical protein D6775_03755 [Caldilineae bacterium]|nr:MAG: hypothetical protein D6775_03755 [Caldilineae bacterium]